MRLPRRYLSALATIARRSAIPYGFTITIWTAGAVLEHAHGTPDLGQTYLFLVGAVAGFGLVAVVASGSTAERLEPASGDLIRTGAINVIALSLALGAAALVAMIPTAAAWPVASFAATTVYLLIASIGLTVAHRYPDRRS